MRYEDVEPGEACDLVATLPRGSALRSALSEFGEWGEARECAADVVDEVERFLQLVATGSTEGANRLPRPADLARRKAAAARARSVRERIENTEWEEA